MEKNLPTKITIDPTSVCFKFIYKEIQTFILKLYCVKLISLKAELFRKKEEFRQKKLDQLGLVSELGEYQTVKAGLLYFDEK
jgi:hypothetical protein